MNRAILTIAIVLSFAAGFMSAEILVYRAHQTCENVIVSNNTKMIVINDRYYYPVAMEKINEAKKSIHMVMYEIRWYGNPDGNYHDVCKLAVSLVDAENRGVDVKIILDDGRGYGYVNEDLVEAAQNWSRYFEKHNIEVRFDWSNQTTHDKLIIIDGEIVIVGSTNWSTSALDYNHEANILVENRDVAQEYENYFEELWNMYG